MVRKDAIFLTFHTVWADRRHILLLEPENGRDATVASFITWEYAITLSKDCNFKSGSVYNDRILLQNVTILETETFPLLGDFCLLKIDDLVSLEDALPKSFFPCFQDSLTQTVKNSLDQMRPSSTQAPTTSPGKVRTLLNILKLNISKNCR